MKYIITSIASIFMFILTTNLSTAASLSNDARTDLVQQMSEDDEVVDFIYNSLHVGIISDLTQGNLNSLPQKHVVKSQEIISSAISGANAINNRYTAFEKLTLSEKRSVLTEIATTVFKPQNVSLGQCRWEATKTFFRCEGYAAGWTIVKYSICMAVSAGADILALAATEGAAAGALELAIVAQHKYCMSIALGTGSSLALSTVCPGFYFENLAECKRN